MRTLARLMAIACSALALAAPAWAQTWPTKTVRVIVPYAPGSATDIVPRTVFEQVAAQVGHTILIDNRPGGGTTVGTSAVAKSDPDGHTILVHSNALVTTPAIQANIPYDPVRDFSAITPLGNVPLVLVISPDNPGPIAGVDQVVRLDPEPFQSIRRVIFEFGLGVYLKLALFALKGFDRLVYFDLDTLIVDDVSELWDPNRYADKDLYAVREEARYGGRSPMIGHLNSGVMILNRAMLDGRIFQTALSLARAGRSLDAGDQGVINALLSDASQGLAVGELDPMLNVLVNDITLESGLFSKVPARILHFTGNFKPWNRGVESGVPYGPAMRRLWLEHTRALSQ